MAKYTHLILHGSFGSPHENWFGWLKDQLESQGLKALAPVLPTDDWQAATNQGKGNFTPRVQSLSSWLTTLEDLLPQLDTKNLTIYAHSSAPLLVLHFLARHPQITLRGAYFVAPFLGKIGDIWQIEKVNESFYMPANFNYENIRNQLPEATVYFSNNDPYVAEKYSIEFAKKIGAKTKQVDGAGHFNTESGYTEFAQLAVDSVGYN